MNAPDIDSDLQSTAQHVAELTRRVHIDLSHKARLREELVRRHQELVATERQRTATTLWPRLPRFTRLTLVAPPAFAVVVAVIVAIAALQVSGHQSTQSAEAARITRALVQTVPTLTSWQVDQHLERNHATYSGAQCRWRLGPAQRLYIARRGGQYNAYYYSAGQWYRISADQSTGACPSEFVWAFAVLPTELARHDVRIDQGIMLDGRRTDRIQYMLDSSRGQTREATAWVDHDTGLLLRLQRVTTQGGKVVERAVADYRYGYSAKGAA
jgi:hypothetical protein